MRKSKENDKPTTSNGKLTKERHEKLIRNKRELKIWLNFYESISSEESKYAYTNSLWGYMAFDHITKYSQLIDRPLEKTKTSIQNYIVSLKNRGLSTSFIRFVKAAIKHFYDMNEIENLGWKRLSKFRGAESKHEDRGYTHQEISKVLAIADYRLKVCINLEKSGGLRVGALNTIKVGHLTKKENAEGGDCYKIDVYKGTKGNGKYFSFCDPETALSIDTYLDWRKGCGETITPDSPLLRADFNPKDPEKVKNVEMITKEAVRKDMDNNLIKAGLRTVEKGNKFHRFDTKANHAYRKFFRTQLALANVDYDFRKALVGHNPKDLDRVYAKFTEDQLFEEYKKAIKFLRIDKTAELEEKVAEKQEEIDKFEQMEIEHQNEIDLMRVDNQKQIKKVLDSNKDLEAEIQNLKNERDAEIILLNKKLEKMGNERENLKQYMEEKFSSLKKFMESKNEIVDELQHLLKEAELRHDKKAIKYLTERLAVFNKRKETVTDVLNR